MKDENTIREKLVEVDRSLEKIEGEAAQKREGWFEALEWVLRESDD